MVNKKYKIAIFAIICILFSSIAITTINASESNEQIFEIAIIPEIGEESNEIVLSASINNPIKNPLEFNLNINYSNLNNLDCELEINNVPSEQMIIQIPNELYTENNKIALTNTFNLGLGEKNWLIRCRDRENASVEIVTTPIETFTIEESPFSISVGKNYLKGKEIEIDSIGLISQLTLFYPEEGNINLATNSDVITKNLSAGTYIIQASNDYYAETRFRNTSFYVMESKILTNKTIAEPGEAIKLSLILNSPEKQITSMEIDTDDGTINTNHLTPDSTSTIELTHSYEDAGNYVPELRFLIDSTPIIVEGPTISVQDPADNNEAPDISLISPKENSIIESDTITFKYEVDDDEEIEKCTFELYKNLESWKELDYTTNKNSPTLNEEIEVKLTAFDDGEYTWYVICEDKDGKETEEKNDLTVKTTKHEYEEEIDQAIEDLEDFLDKKEDYKLEEKEVLEELGISEDLTYYSKRLVQIDQDLGTNIKFISNENLKEERTEETIEELEEIIKNIPQDIEIVDSSEFIKNSLTDLEQITREYSEGKKIQLRDNEIRKLAEQNELIQEDLGVTTKIKTVEVKYSDRTERITSVKKEINLMSSAYKTILEKIPDEIKEIEFKTTSQEVNKNLFEIKIENIKDDEIVYYIKEEVKLNKLKEAETLLFEEFSIKGISITGYFSFNGEGKNNTTYYILFLVFLAIALYFGKDVFKKLKMNIWKKEEDVRRILEYSEKAKKALQNNDQEAAKEDYHKIKEIFGLTPKGFRDYIYPTIKKIRIGIDKRDMQNFIKEYEEANREKRTEDAKRIYQNIREQYKKLPQKHQEKVYERVIKKGTDGFSF